MRSGSGRVRVEQGAKRVRAYLGGEVVADSVRPRLVWEVPYYPAYYFPLEDVRTDLLVPTATVTHSPSRGDAQHFTVKAGGKEAVDAALRHVDSPIEELRGLIRLDWDAMDGWFEEDEEVYTHPRDPYTRVDILASSRRVRPAHPGVGHHPVEPRLPGRGRRPAQPALPGQPGRVRARSRRQQEVDLCRHHRRTARPDLGHRQMEHRLPGGGDQPAQPPVPGQPGAVRPRPGRQHEVHLRDHHRRAARADLGHRQMEHRLPGRAGRPGRSPLPGNPGGVRPGPAGNKKSIYAVTTDGRLAQIWDTTKWNLSFPAELANAGSLRFQV